MKGDQSVFPTSGIETDLMGDGSGHKYPHTYSYELAGGLTKRELFAAMAMQGMCTGDTFPREADLPEIAKRAVAAADALLSRLNQRTEPWRRNVTARCPKCGATSDAKAETMCRPEGDSCPMENRYRFAVIDPAAKAEVDAVNREVKP